MSSNSNLIREYLNHSKNGENYKKLLVFLKEPRTFSQMRFAKVKGDTFKVLVDLKKAGALLFSEGKYYSSQEALEILKSL